MPLRWFCLTVMFSAFAVVAQPAQAEATRQQWLTLTGDVKLDEDDTLSANLILRSRPDSFEVGQRFLRLGYTHALNYDVSLTLNYAHVTTVVDGGSDLFQHRLAQSIAVKLLPHVDGRVQLEEVFGVTGSDYVGVRFRPRARLRQPLDADGEIELQLTEEAIFALNDTDFGQASGFTANRAGAAVHFDLGEHFAIMPGYTWQLINRSGAPVRNDHILGLTLEVHY